MRALGVRAALCLAFALAPLMLAERARAEPASSPTPPPAAATSPVRLTYTAPDICPTSASFFAQLEARTRLVRLAGREGRATRLTVSIAAVAGGTSGRLTMSGPEGFVAEREVTAVECEQVVAALALITALALDPNASAAPIASAPHEVAREAPAAPKNPLPARPTPPVPPPITTAPVRADRFRFDVGGSLELVSAVAPGLLRAPRVWLEAARGESLASLTIRLSFAAGQRVTRVSDGAAEISWLAAQLEVCPLRLGTPFSALLVCGALDGGRRRASGSDVAPSEQVSRPWFAAGASTHFELAPFSWLALDLGGRAFAPFFRDRLYVNTDTTVHRTPAVGGAIELGLLLRFP